MWTIYLENVKPRTLRTGQEGNEREMGKEQELTQAIKNNDVELVKKVLAKFKTKPSKLSWNLKMWNFDTREVRDRNGDVSKQTSSIVFGFEGIQVFNQTVKAPSRFKRLASKAEFRDG